MLPLYMSKIRINELARQLEVPSHAIIDMLPELGVTEKKTHSSSIDEPVAEIIRQRVQGGAGAAMRREADASVAVAEPEPMEPPRARSPSRPPPPKITSTPHESQFPNLKRPRQPRWLGPRRRPPLAPPSAPWKNRFAASLRP